MTGLRRAGPADAPAIELFLMGHIQTSMFPLGNLRTHGIDGDGARSMRFWLDDAAGHLRGLVGVTVAGIILPQMPDPDADWAGFAAVCPSPVLGILGGVAQVRTCLAALGLTTAPMQLNVDEPGFSLMLADLVVPQVPQARLDPVTAADRALIVDWRIAYEVEIVGTRSADAPGIAAQYFDSVLAADSHRILRLADRPVATTGFNARLPGTVQIGGVFTPPDLRGRGYARLAVALHLLQAQADGVDRAVLFSSSNAASRAYRSIGFVKTGDFAIVLFDGPQQVRRG